jgi:hypothetical protein
MENLKLLKISQLSKPFAFNNVYTVIRTLETNKLVKFHPEITQKRCNFYMKFDLLIFSNA